MAWSPEQLRAALNEATDIAPEVTAVVKKAAVNVKKEWRASASGLAHAPAYPYSIDFDPVGKSGGTIGTEVGPDKGKRQGALGNLIEYGSVNNPPHGDGKRAADAELPVMEKYLLQVVAKKLW